VNLRVLAGPVRVPAQEACFVSRRWLLRAGDVSSVFPLARGGRS